MLCKSAIYVRSSKDLHNVSCEAQEQQLRKIVNEKGEIIFRVFCDKALSSTRDVRPEFNEMLNLAFSKNPPFTKIYCLDTSRFGRDQTQTQLILYKLRKRHGIEVIFANMPNTGTFMDGIMESIFHAFDELHSQLSKEKGVASMKQNIENGYRAGGRAPYGYRLKQIEIGKHRNGDTLTKSQLVPDDETAPIAREYFQRRAKMEPRRTILDDFYQRGIPSPTGQRRWIVSTAKSMEDNIDTYLGHLIFNRHNERIKERGRVDGYLGGKKWRPKEEWVVHENAHEALIDEATAERVREIKKRGLREVPYHKRVYALSGILKCEVCGTNFVGDGGLYRCNSKSKIGKRCPNQGISQDEIENAVFSVLFQQILRFKNLQPIIKQIKERFQKGDSTVNDLQAKIQEVDRERKRLIELAQKGLVSVGEIDSKMNELNEAKEAMAQHLEDTKKSKGVVEVTDEMIEEVLAHLHDKLENADPEIKKSLAQSLFNSIFIAPKEGSPWERKLTINGIYLPFTGVMVASPRGFEPLLPA